MSTLETAPVEESAPQQQPAVVDVVEVRQAAIQPQENAALEEAFVAEKANVPETTQKPKTTIFRTMPKLGAFLSKVLSFNRGSNSNSDAEAAPRAKRTKSKLSQ